MSAKATFWAWDLAKNPNISATEHHVLLALANFANETNQLWYSYAKIADSTRLSRRSVIRACDRLQEIGVLMIANRVKEDGKNQTNLFTLLIPKCEWGSDTVSPGVVTGCHQGSDTVSPKSNSESNSNNISPIVPLQGNECPYDEILSLQREILPNIRGARILTDKRKSAMRKMWKKKDGLNTLKQWENYFRDLAQYDYWQGRVKGMIPDFDLLIREQTIVKAYEGYYADKQAEHKQRNGGTYNVRG